jgi:hypothetical protein
MASVAVAVVGCSSGGNQGDAAPDAMRDADVDVAVDGPDGQTVADADAPDGLRDVAPLDDVSPSDVSPNDVSPNDGGDVADRPTAPDVVDSHPTDDAADAADASSPSDGPLNARYVFKVPVLAEQMVADPVRRRFYVSVGGASPQYPNTLLTVDANTGAVLSTPYVGSNPRSLALADDASTLWIGVDGPLSIRRLTLTTDPPGVGPLTALTQALGAGQTAGPMVGLPGAPLSVVVSTPDGKKTVVLDDGVARSTSASTLGRSASLLVAGSAGYVYGYNSQSTAFGFLTMTVSAAGISDLSTTPNLLSGFGNQIVYQAGRVYAASGEVIDVTTPNHPVAGGRLPCVGPIALGPPNRLFVLSGDSPDAAGTLPTQILVVDGTALKIVAMIPFPPDLYPRGFDVSAGTSSVVYLGPDALAFLVRAYNYTTSEQSGTLVIIRDPLIAALN